MIILFQQIKLLLKFVLRKFHICSQSMLTTLTFTLNPVYFSSSPQFTLPPPHSSLSLFPTVHFPSSPFHFSSFSQFIFPPPHSSLSLLPTNLPLMFTSIHFILWPTEIKQGYLCDNDFGAICGSLWAQQWVYSWRCWLLFSKTINGYYFRGKELGLINVSFLD